MNLIELERSLRQLRLGGMAAVLETRLRQAQTEAMTPLDLIASLVSDELIRRSDRLLERRRKQAEFRDADKGLENFDFNFNPKMNRSLIFDLATSAFIGKREDARRFSRAIACSTARHTCCSTTWPKRSPTAHVESLWKR
jgi:DNA replication protein DnaC